MKVVFTIIIVLVYFAVLIPLLNEFFDGKDFILKLLSVAGIIGLSYGGYKLIRYIFQKE